MRLADITALVLVTSNAVRCLAITQNSVFRRTLPRVCTEPTLRGDRQTLNGKEGDR